jgi:hypothetical protein
MHASPIRSLTVPSSTAFRRSCRVPRSAPAQYGHFRYRFPDEQAAPHRSFETEHDHLARLFPGVGKASTLAGGDVYAVDASARCWHVYVADLSGHHHLTSRANTALFAGFVPAEGLEAIRGAAQAGQLQAADDARSSAASTTAPDPRDKLRSHGYQTPLRTTDSSDALTDERTEPETVLEVAMEGLSARFASHFFFDGVVKRAAEPHACARASGIEALMPGVQLDPWCFEPCGFSLNGLRDGYYFTIHITPEPQMSFGSFETNDPRYSTKGFVQALLATFEPEHAAILVTARAADGAPPPLADCAESLVGYRQLRATQDKFGPSIGARCTVIEKRALAPLDRA